MSDLGLPLRHPSRILYNISQSNQPYVLAVGLCCQLFGEATAGKERSGRASRGRAARRTLWLVVHPAPARLADGRSSALRPGVRFAGSSSTRLRLPGIESISSIRDGRLGYVKGWEARHASVRAARYGRSGMGCPALALRRANKRSRRAAAYARSRSCRSS